MNYPYISLLTKALFQASFLGRGVGSSIFVNHKMKKFVILHLQCFSFEDDIKVGSVWIL